MKISAIILALTLLGTVTYAQAGNQWIICNVEITIDKVMQQERKLSAHVTRLIGTQASICPALSSQVTFTPETPDYQNELPRRDWPRAGAKAKLQSRYLYGECKDRGPCVIEHHSIMSKHRQ